MIAVIPAAGKATRFGGLYKECLPIAGGQYLLSSAIERADALGATGSVVISSPHKADFHSAFLEQHSPKTGLLVQNQHTDPELWGAIRTALPLCVADGGLLVLPDTHFVAIESVPANCDLAFGLFLTEEPERFSVLANGTIRTKVAGQKGPKWAWGAVYWSSRVAQFWLDDERLLGNYADYDEAFQDAIDKFNYRTFNIADYHDLGSWVSYERFIRR